METGNFLIHFLFSLYVRRLPPNLVLPRPIKAHHPASLKNATKSTKRPLISTFNYTLLPSLPRDQLLPFLAFVPAKSS